MSQHSYLLVELEQNLKLGSSEKRIDTLRRVTDLFLTESERLAEDQVRIFDDVLVRLVDGVERAALAQLSTSLAGTGNAPIHIVKQLAHDDDISVAKPILSQSSRLEESDLIEIAKTKGQEHLLAISGRASVSEAITDVLVDRGDSQVVQKVAGNLGARFSEKGFTTLTRRAEADDALAESLGVRLDLPAPLLNQLLAKANDVVRARLVAAAPPEQRDKIQRSLADVMNRITQHKPAPRNFAAATSHVQEMNRFGKLNEGALARFARAGEIENVVAALALFAQCPIETIQRAVENVSSEALLLVCKATNMSWPTTDLILRNRFPDHSPSGAEIAEAKQAFGALSQPEAQRALRFMLVNRATRKSA